MERGERHETDCHEVLAEVYLYLDLECADERRAVIRHHLDECSPCLREYGIEREVKAMVARCCSSPPNGTCAMPRTMRRMSPSRRSPISSKNAVGAGRTTRPF